METKRTHIVIPQQLAAQIDTLVGKRGRSAFFARAAEKELLRLRQIRALKAASGSWKDKDHPELRRGASHWVDQRRREDERRFTAFSLKKEILVSVVYGDFSQPWGLN